MARTAIRRTFRVKALSMLLRPADLGAGEEIRESGVVGWGRVQPHAPLHYCCQVVTLELPLLPNPSVAMIW